MTGIQFNAREALKALDGMAAGLATTVKNNTVERIAKNVYAGAYERLSGPRIPKKDWYRSPLAGSYPVPVRLGHLRRALFMILPGGVTVGGDGNVPRYNLQTGEAYVGDSAEYGWAIHEGLGTRGKGRPYLTDAAQEAIGMAPAICEEELAKEIRKHGLD